MTGQHKPCPFCTGTGTTTTGRGSDGPERCDDCQGTGKAVTWSARGRHIGGHWRVAIFAGRRGSRANLGTLMMDDDDWTEWKLQAIHFDPPIEIEEDPVA